MKIRIVQTLLASVALAAAIAPAAIAADLTDVGFVDQAQIAALPAFASAGRQFAAYQASIGAQAQAALKSAKTDADRQRLYLQFQQQLRDKQSEIVGPVYARAQLAIAAVASSKNLSIIVDKRIVVYGGQDVTSDVLNLIQSPQAISAPSASPPPSEIGSVDESALNALPKVQAANASMNSFATDQKKIFAAKFAAAKTDADKAQVQKDFSKTLDDKQSQLLQPLIDQTKRVTAQIAAQKKLLLVIDRGDVVYGGTDITKDVQDALNK